MYLGHFGLTEFPFGLTPDTQYYYDLPSHRDALDVLLFSLNNGEGFIKITGNVGTGKTMLCRKLLNQLESPFITAYIPNPHLTATGLYTAIANELGISFSSDDGQSSILQKINEYLLNAALNRQKPVLIIDEAQAMPLETLEALRLITNLETEKQKLFQIILFGQPELDDLLQQKSIRQLRQRISFSHVLNQLTASDVDAYIKHRLSVANSDNPTVFSKSANKALHFYSKGIPRLVNILAHKALLSAFGKGLTQVGIKQVQLAARDTEDTRKRRYPFQYSKGISLALVFSLCLFIIPFLHLNNSNQSIFDMSLLNQVLQDLEKRSPDNKSEQHQSVSAIPSNISQNKLFYIPIALICITGIFMFIKYRSNEIEKAALMTDSQIKTAPPPEEIIISKSIDSGLVESNSLEKTQKEETTQVAFLQETEVKKSETAKPKQVKIPEKEKQLAEQFFETAKKQQKHVDKKLNLNLALKLNPEHIEARLLLSNTLLHLGLADEAANLLDQSIELFPQNQQFINLRSQLSYQNKQIQKAFNILQQIDANYKKDALVITESNEQEQHKKNKTEIKKAKKTVSIKATASVTKSKKIKTFSKKQQAKKLFEIAKKSQSLAKKQIHLEQAINLNPQHINARLLLADTLFNQNQTEKAAEFLDQSLELFSDNLQFINLRSQLLLKEKQPQAALTLLSKAGTEDTQDEAYLSLLGAAYQQNHDSASAQKTYQKLVKINPEKAENWLGLAMASEKQGEDNQALDAYQQALDKNSLKDSIVSYIKQRISLLKK